MKSKSLLALLGCLFLIIGMSVGTALAEDPDEIVGEGESFAGSLAEAVTVSFTDLSGSPITSVSRGTGFKVWVSWSTPIDGYKYTCIGLVKWGGGNNTILVQRTSTTPNVVGSAVWVITPSWATPGPVWFIASVKDRGMGFASITLN